MQGFRKNKKCVKLMKPILSQPCHVSGETAQQGKSQSTKTVSPTQQDARKKNGDSLSGKKMIWQLLSL